MSRMEAVYGKYWKSDETLEEGEDAYDASERLNKELVDVDGTLYEYEIITSLDEYGFTLHIPASDENRFVCLWYNGGAGQDEVIEEAIRSSL